MDNIMGKMFIGDELDKALMVLPTYEASIRQNAPAERLMALQDIYKVFIPNQMSREIYSKLYLSLYRSLNKKQSIAAVRQSNENSKLIRRQSYESIIGGADSFTIIGQSGIGKSASVSRSLRIITDKNCIWVNNSKVVPCLTVQAPADASIKGMLLEIVRRVDEEIDTNYYQTLIKTKATVDRLIGSVSQICLNNVGLLVLDEIQNVVNSKNGSAIVGTLTQLINNSAVAICMVGTPESALFFDSAMMLARRSLGLSYSTMEYGDEYKRLCNSLLGYIYVKEPPVVDDAMMMWIYNHTGGNASITVTLIHDAQEIAILEGYEKLDMYSLNKAYDNRLSMLHDYINLNHMKKHPMKRKAHDNLLAKVDTLNDADYIYKIAMATKNSGENVVNKLIANSIKVLEVEI